MAIKKTNLAHMKNLEDYLARSTVIDLQIKNEDSPIAETIYSSAKKKKFYSTAAGIQSVKEEVLSLMEDYVAKTGAAGRNMSLKAMETWLTAQEKRMVTPREKYLTLKLNERQMTKRMELYTAQLEKEFGILKADIDIYRINADLAGISVRDQYLDLVRMANNRDGFVQQFTERTQKVVAASARREGQEQALEEYKIVAGPGDDWQWITVSSNPCPDCQARAGKVLTLTEWEGLGLPGEGQTICGVNCMCQLIPLTVSEELFPDQKEFTFDKSKLVLTTAADARKLASGSQE